MRKIINKKGKKFGRLTAISFIRKRSRQDKVQIFWKCKCDCGNTTLVFSNSLGKTKSCGCLKKEISLAMILSKTKHGESGNNKTDIYRLWKGIKGRVKSTSNRSYKYYLAKGIKMCKKWEHDYLSFKKWAIDNDYKKGLYIDRINNNKNYSPSNCRFVTVLESNRNRSKSKN